MMIFHFRSLLAASALFGLVLNHLPSVKATERKTPNISIGHNNKYKRNRSKNLLRFRRRLFWRQSWESAIQTIVVSEAFLYFSKLCQVPLTTLLRNTNIALYGVFALSSLFHEELESFIADNFILSSNARKRQKRPHTLLASGFMHASFSHVSSNMAAMMAHGEVFLLLVGPRKMMYFYTIALHCSTVFNLHVYEILKKRLQQLLMGRRADQNQPNGYVGASGAIYAVVTYVLLAYPEMPIELGGCKFGGLEAAVALVCTEAFPYLLEENRKHGEEEEDLLIGHGAHIGGILYGVFYFYLENLLSSSQPWAPFFSWRRFGTKRRRRRY